MRLIAIGDIHGHRNKLDDLLEQIQPCDEDQFVFLGDYIDRGPDSKGVIEDLIDFQLFFPNTVFLRGNHEQLMIDTLIDCGVTGGTPLYKVSPAWARETRYSSDAMLFYINGGDETLKNYGVEVVREGMKHTLLGTLPQDHIDFLSATRLFFEYGEYIFVHAGIDPCLPLDEQDPHLFLWSRRIAPIEGKTLIVGHTPTTTSLPAVSTGIIELDTGAAYGEPLTAMDVLSGQVWQTESD
jgi:serine/threonine protein phosphatase 1